MDGNKCTKCGKVINNNTFTRCEDCWITVSPSGSQPGEPISRKETLEMSSALLTQAEKERYGETDELAEILKTDCNWDCGDSLRACRIIADRVNGQTSINSMQAANNREVYKRSGELEDRIRKLEKDLGQLDEVFNESNLRDLKVHSDFEGRIKELETKVGMKHISVTNNAEQTRNCYACGTTDFKEEDGLNHYGLSVQVEGKPDILLCRKCLKVSPQATNPLTREEIELIRDRIYSYYKGGIVYPIETQIMSKLNSYLEK